MEAKCGPVIRVDKPAPPPRPRRVPALLPPARTNQEIVEVCFFLPLLATPFAGVDACLAAIFLPPFFCLSFFLSPDFWLRSRVEP